jgi:hypothetical protein
MHIIITNVRERLEAITDKRDSMCPRHMLRK